MGFRADTVGRVVCDLLRVGVLVGLGASAIGCQCERNCKDSTQTGGRLVSAMEPAALQVSACRRERCASFAFAGVDCEASPYETRHAFWNELHVAIACSGGLGAYFNWELQSHRVEDTERYVVDVVDLNTQAVLVHIDQQVTYDDCGCGFLDWPIKPDAGSS
jgi:hypothetical protein